MSDLISREKLKKEAESLRVTVMGLRSGKGILAEYAKHYRESFLRMIDEQPTVEPVRGEWKYYKKQRIAVCTNCSFERNLDDNFGRAISCPNCGADMRGERND